MRPESFASEDRLVLFALANDCSEVGCGVARAGCDPELPIRNVGL